MVAAMGGSGFITAASLQIKDAGNHILPTKGAIFIVITRLDGLTGLEKRTHQVAYVSPRAEDLILLAAPAPRHHLVAAAALAAAV